MYDIKKEFFKKGQVIFTDGVYNFKYKVIEGNKLNALMSGPFMTFKGGIIIETDRYIPNLDHSHRIKLENQENTYYIRQTDPIEDNRKNMFKKNAYTGMYIALN